jgi:hypothetical protein
MVATNCAFTEMAMKKQLWALVVVERDPATTLQCADGPAAAQKMFWEEFLTGPMGLRDHRQNRWPEIKQMRFLENVWQFDLMSRMPNGVVLFSEFVVWCEQIKCSYHVMFLDSEPTWICSLAE